LRITKPAKSNVRGSARAPRAVRCAPHRFFAVSGLTRLIFRPASAGKRQEPARPGKSPDPFRAEGQQCRNHLLNVTRRSAKMARLAPAQAGIARRVPLALKAFRRPFRLQFNIRLQSF